MPRDIDSMRRLAALVGVPLEDADVEALTPMPSVSRQPRDVVSGRRLAPASLRESLQPHAPAMHPRVMDVAVGAQPQADDYELALARLEDEARRRQRGMELAARQIAAAGAPGVSVGPLVSPEEGAVAELLRRRSLDMQREALQAREATAEMVAQQRARAADLRAQEAELRAKELEQRGRRLEAQEARAAAREARDKELDALRAQSLRLGLTTGMEELAARRQQTARQQQESEASRYLTIGDVVYEAPEGTPQSRLASGFKTAEGASALQGALSDLEKELTAYAATPTRDKPAFARTRLAPRVGVVAGQLSNAFNTGVLSETEYRRAMAAIGADPTNPMDAASRWLTSLVAGEEGEALVRDTTTRLRSVQQSIMAAMEAKLKTQGFTRRGQPASADTVTLVGPDGTEYDVPAGRVDAILKAKPQLRRK